MRSRSMTWPMAFSLFPRSSSFVVFSQPTQLQSRQYSPRAKHSQYSFRQRLFLQLQLLLLTAACRGEGDAEEAEEAEETAREGRGGAMREDRYG